MYIVICTGLYIYIYHVDILTFVYMYIHTYIYIYIYICMPLLLWGAPSSSPPPELKSSWHIDKFVTYTWVRDIYIYKCVDLEAPPSRPPYWLHIFDLLIYLHKYWWQKICTYALLTILFTIYVYALHFIITNTYMFFMQIYMCITYSYVYLITYSYVLRINMHILLRINLPVSSTLHLQIYKYIHYTLFSQIYLYVLPPPPNQIYFRYWSFFLCWNSQSFHLQKKRSVSEIDVIVWRG